MRLSLGHRGARWVLVVRRRSPGDETWWSPRLGARPPDWSVILLAPLALLGLAPRQDGTAAWRWDRGHVEWRHGRSWSVLGVRVEGGSIAKRRLTASMLLKAARYGRPRTGAR
jgi:hypothetical protein